jgi:squalene-hopene/tetraprenyl-beta-curcumene cyclase
MFARATAILALLSWQVVDAEWNPRLAADYLDARQQIWFNWPIAKTSTGPCLSCHTGFPYLLARPRLRQLLGESGRTVYEVGLLDAVRKRLAKATPQEFLPDRNEPENTGVAIAGGQRLPKAAEELGVESVFAALLLALEDSHSGALSSPTNLAFKRMWSLQVPSGEAKGAWKWNNIDLDPWEEPESTFYGASLAALAIGVAPSNYQARREIRPNVESLKAYLRSWEQKQPLHNRLVQLWASTRLTGILSERDGQTLRADVLRRQEADGGWTISSLGPWREHAGAPVSRGSDGYATALVAFILQRAGMSREDPRLRRALNWLRSHQDRNAGFWETRSMNKRYPADSIPEHFMQDAATAFAALALLESP